MRRITLAASLLALVAAPAAHAAVEPPVIASGPTPFAPGCERATQTGTVFPNAEVEPWVAASPVQPGRLVAVWQQDRWSNGGARGLLTGLSLDAGRTWTRPTPPPFSRCAGGTAANGGDYERASDPWVSLGADGDAYQIALGIDDSRPTSAILVSKSEDGGATWGPITTLIRDESPLLFNDKESITADPTDARFAYAVWDRLEVPAPDATVFSGPTLFSRTADGGRTWTPPRPIVEPGPDAQTLGNQIVVLPSGTLVNVFALIVRGQAFVAVLRSADHGRTWSRRPAVIDRLASVGVVDPRDGAPVRAGELLPETAVDPTRPETLHVVWQDGRFTRGARDQVVIATSGNGGRSWQRPRRVSANPATQAFTPSVHVDATGTAAVTYYDFTADTPTSAPLSTDAWLARSTDGGRSFAPRERLTSRSFDMRAAPVARGFFVGDYEGLTAVGDAAAPVFVVANDGAPGNPTDVLATLAPPSPAPPPAALAPAATVSPSAPDGARGRGRGVLVR